MEIKILDTMEVKEKKHVLLSRINFKFGRQYLRSKKQQQQRSLFFSLIGCFPQICHIIFKTTTTTLSSHSEYIPYTLRYVKCIVMSWSEVNLLSVVEDCYMVPPRGLIIVEIHYQMNFNPVWFTPPLELPNLDLKIQPLALECPTASPL